MDFLKCHLLHNSQNQGVRKGPDPLSLPQVVQVLARGAGWGLVE